MDDPIDKKTERQMFGEDHDACMMCGPFRSRGKIIETHEIARGPFRQSALEASCAWLRLCRDCHNTVDGLHPTVQYAVKRLADPERYDRQWLNKLRGRDKDAISEQEVDAVLLARQGCSGWYRCHEMAKAMAEFPLVTRKILDPLNWVLKAELRRV